MLEELKQEKYEIPEIEDIVNKKIEEFVNDPELVGSLYEEGKTIIGQSKKQFRERDIRMYIAKELVSKNAGFELERKIDDVDFRKKYDNINYLGIITAMVAYKDSQPPEGVEIIEKDGKTIIKVSGSKERVTNYGINKDQEGKNTLIALPDSNKYDSDEETEQLEISEKGWEALDYLKRLGKI